MIRRCVLPADGDNEGKYYGDRRKRNSEEKKHYA